MKVLIYLLTFIIGTFINTLIGQAIGIRLGAYFLYIIEFFIAKKICDKWEETHSGSSNDPGDESKK